MPSKAIVGKSFHGCGSTALPLGGGLKVPKPTKLDSPALVSTALPLGGGLKILMIEDTTLAI